MSTNKWLKMMMNDEKNLLASQAQPYKLLELPSPSLNWALPMQFGLSTCLYGPEGSGKSLASMLALGSAMQQDPELIGVVISTEMRAPEPDRLRILGIDPERLVIRMANELHDVFDWIQSVDSNFKNQDGTKGGPGFRYMLEQGAPIKVLIIDSVKAIRGPKESNAESVTKDIMGDLSKYLNPSLKGMLPIIRQYKILTILVQQVNMNLDADEVKYQNKKWVIPSGQSLKHFCETMALVEKVTSKDSKIFDESMKSIRELPVQMGHTIRVRVDKNNLGRPNREAEFRIHYNKGYIQPGLEVGELAANLGVIFHPKNPDTGKEIINQWQFKNRNFVGLAKVIAELEASEAFRTEVLIEIKKLDKIELANQDTGEIEPSGDE